MTIVCIVVEDIELKLQLIHMLNVILACSSCASGFARVHLCSTCKHGYESLFLGPN